MTQYRSRSIILVEDDDDVRETLTIILEFAGYTVQACATGQEALGIIRGTEWFDVMLTDVAMLPPNGIELAQQAARLRPDMGVVMISGYAKDSLGIAELPPGCIFLAKPFTIDVLNDALLRAIRAPALVA